MDSQPSVVVDHRSRKLQALRRELNEQLRRLEQRDGEFGTLRLLCECGRCNDEVIATAGSYDDASSNPGRLLVKAGHEDDGNAPSGLRTSTVVRPTRRL